MEICVCFTLMQFCDILLRRLVVFLKRTSSRDCVVVVVVANFFVGLYGKTTQERIECDMWIEQCELIQQTLWNSEFMKLEV